MKTSRLLAGLLVLSLAGGAAAQPMGIPSMGAASSAQLSPMLEQTLGDAIMEQGRRDPTYISDPQINQYLSALGHRLAAHGGMDMPPITVFAVRDPEINAFTLPGGYIGVNSGLVLAADDESELASVIAHEIGHVSQRHIARGLAQEGQSRGVVIASVVGALLAALAGSGDLAMGVAAFGQAAAIDRQLGYSRQAEQEADRIGLELMRKAGYDPRGMVRMFRRLMATSSMNEGAGGNPYVSSHPLSIQRMSDMENRIQEMPGAAHKDADDFWYARARLRVMQARRGDASRAALSVLNRDAESLSGVPAAAARYGIAYAALQSGETASARAALARAQASGRDSPQLSALAVDVALASGAHEQALQQARKAWARWPLDQGVALAMVRALQKSGQDAEALRFIRERIKQWPDLAVLDQLEANTQEKLGRQVEARRAMARYYEKTGALPSAAEQLRQARELSDDFYVKSELDVQIRELKERLNTQRQLLERFRS